MKPTSQMGRGKAGQTNRNPGPATRRKGRQNKGHDRRDYQTLLNGHGEH
jgi:hypothetical protein